MRVTLIYSEDELVLSSKPVNNPKNLLEAIQTSNLIETNNQAVIDKFRSLIHNGFVEEGVVCYNGKDFKFDKYGHYEGEVPSYFDENLNDISSLL